MTEVVLAGWHHQLNGHEFQQTQEDGEGQGCLECCSSWGCKELHTTRQLNSNNKSLSLGRSTASPTPHGPGQLKNNYLGSLVHWL